MFTLRLISLDNEALKEFEISLYQYNRDVTFITYCGFQTCIDTFVVYVSILYF